MYHRWDFKGISQFGIKLMSTQDIKWKNKSSLSPWWWERQSRDMNTLMLQMLFHLASLLVVNYMVYISHDALHRWQSQIKRAWNSIACSVRSAAFHFTNWIMQSLISVLTFSALNWIYEAFHDGLDDASFCSWTFWVTKWIGTKHEALLTMHTVLLVPLILQYIICLF